MNAAEAKKLLATRLTKRPRGRLDARTILHHFALITYAVPVERLAPHVTSPHHEVEEFTDGERRFGLISVVPFLDTDFGFPRLAPWLKYEFGQTNYRIYIRDKRTNEPSVWFLGTTLGSWLVHIPRILWKLPWHTASYNIDCRYNKKDRRYDTWRFDTKSDWAPAAVVLHDTGQPVGDVCGFTCREVFTLLLTHPISGFYRRLDGKLGGYSIAHPPMHRLTVATVEYAWFGLLERLNIASREEMQTPHSVFLLPRIRFEIQLPPKKME